MAKSNDIVSLDTPINKLEKKLLKENDADQIKNIIDIFNANIKKKDVIRTAKLSELQDMIADQLTQRIQKNSDAFNNKDLLDYFKTIQDVINKADMSSEIKVPVQIQQQINVNVDNSELDRESKNRVLEAIRAILDSNKEEAIEAEFSVQEETKVDESGSN